MRRLILAGLLLTQSLPAAWAKDQTKDPAKSKQEITNQEASLTDSVPGFTPLSVHLEKNTELVVNLALEGSQLVLERDGKQLEVRSKPGAIEKFNLPDTDQPGQTYRYRVRLLDRSGKELIGQTLNLTTPAPALQLHVSANQVFGTHLNPLVCTTDPGSLQLLLDGQIVHSRTIIQKGSYVLPALPLGPGRHHLQVVLQSGKSKIESLPVQIFSFGVEPLDHDYLLADKYNFTLYWIRSGVLFRIYPVATGRPGLPTQPGFWLIGGKDVWFPESDWGSFRLRIYRENQYKTHWSGYAVHGTNKPNSIGTEASHGCLRMYNKDVTELYQGVQVGMPLQIEEKLPVYIESINPPGNSAP